jgi:pimeloyl-ACP methyl ester carboxylesterase
MEGLWIRHPPTKGLAVVFVHGVLSSGETCWRHANGVYWPNVLTLEPEPTDLGVYVFTYRTGFFSGTFSVTDASASLKEHLDLDEVVRARRIVFVCHSMGGLVVRKYLVDRAADLIERDISVGLFLIASPSLGADYADWLRPLAKLVGHSQADALRFIRDNMWLMDLDRAFMDLKEAGRLRMNGKELIEDRFIIGGPFWRKQVVEPFAGARYFGEHYKVPDSDHSSIAKIKGPNDIQHRQLMKFIRGSEPPARLSTQADNTLIPRLQRLISRPEARGCSSAAYLLYISRDRVSSLFHQVSSETLLAAVSPGQGWLQYGEPGASSADERSRRALVNQLAAVLAHLAECANIADLDDAIASARLDADWYVIRARFQSSGWVAAAATHRIATRIGDFKIELTCTTSNFASVVEERGVFMPTSTSSILFSAGQLLDLSGLVRLVSFDQAAKTLSGTALFLALQPLELAL